MDLEETFNILYKKVDKHLTWMVEIFTHVGRWGGCMFHTGKIGPTTMLEISVWVSKPGTGRCYRSLQNF